jgi:hypothetical protein
MAGRACRDASTRSRRAGGVQLTAELETKTRQLEAAKRQIADLRRLFEVRKKTLPNGVPEISDYYMD